MANSSVLGGREEDMTLGMNWYPEVGFRVMANWTRAMLVERAWESRLSQSAPIRIHSWCEPKLTGEIIDLNQLPANMQKIG